jgi:hypothetical protein
MDALCALPNGIEQQVPASLRCTSMCLVACLASPIIAPDVEIEQRGVLLILLVAAAFCGEHHGRVNVRIADALFAIVSGWFVVFVFVARRDDKKSRSEQESPAVSLFGTLLIYVGLRSVRAGLTHAKEASSFNVEAFEITSKGYAVGDGVVSVFITFGGAMLVCTGIFVLFNSKVVVKNKRNVYSISATVAMNSCFVFVSALVVQLSVCARMEHLPALFSHSACYGEVNSCEVAYRARRLYMSNSSPASLWAGCVAATVFSMRGRRGCLSRYDYYTTSNMSTASGVVTVVVASVVTLAVWELVAFGLTSERFDMFFLLLSIPFAWYSTTPLACILNVVGNLMYVDQRLRRDSGLDMSYLTHWSLLVTTILVSLLALCTFVQRVVYAYYHSIVTFDKGKSEWLAPLTGALTVAIVSIQLELTLLTLALVAGYNGSVMTTQTNWRTEGYEYTVQHSLSFFFAAALYGSRYETVDWTYMSKRVRRVAWYSGPIFVCVVWMTAVLFYGTTFPYLSSSYESACLFVGIVCAIVPWAAVGLEA